MRRHLRWLDRLVVQVAFFGRRTRDLIQWVQTSQRTTTPKNIKAAQALGMEAMLGLWIAKIARLTLNYTYLTTKNLST